MDVPVGTTISLVGLGFFQDLTTAELIVRITITILLLLSSGIISASEVAFFSLAPSTIEDLPDTPAKESLKNLLDKPKTLLATILILNNTVNIAVVFFSEPLVSALPINGLPYWVQFLFNVVIITFLILLIGEIIPKVFANRNAQKLALLLSRPASFLVKLCTPLSLPLTGIANIIDKRIQKKEQSISVEELSQALEITGVAKQDNDSGRLLESIVKFGSVDVSTIMTPRVDVFAIDSELSFKEMIDKIVENGYSRVPVYSDNADNIIGLIYAKDLIPHIDKSDDFNWTSLLRKPFFVPENKKIDDLLKEFQSKKIHLAIVVDEYGGTCGIVTLEDILEEIVGEINDEFDVEVRKLIQISDSEFILPAKTYLKDVISILNLPENTFEEWEETVDTLGGVIFEHVSQLPALGQELQIKNLIIKILAIDNRKINTVKVTILSEQNNA